MDSPQRFRLTVVFWIGLALMVLGTGPLLLIVVAAELGLTSDPNPNPIGPGLLAFFTFWPAVTLIAWGLVASVLRYRRQAGSAACADNSLSLSCARLAAGRCTMRAT